jgi:hypothetical protein
MPQSLTEQVRDRSWQYLTPDVASAAGLTLQQLQQFLLGGFSPSPEQVQKLARRVRVTQ